MAKFIDYYKVLGVAKDIPQSEIKAAFRKRSKQFHPDLHPDDPKAKAKFQLLTEAYEVLSNPDKRARYDQLGENWNKVGGGARGQQGWGGPFGQGGYTSGFDMPHVDLSSIFEELFNNGGGHSQQGFNQHRGGCHQGGCNNGGCQSNEEQATVDIDMYTAILGGDVVIQSGNTKLKMKVKEGTQPGTKMRLKGKGQGGKDLILTVNVKLPTNLTERQKELLIQIRG